MERVDRRTGHGSRAGYGQKGDGGYAYFDTRELFGIYTELIELPEVRIPPRATYP